MTKPSFGTQTTVITQVNKAVGSSYVSAITVILQAQIDRAIVYYTQVGDPSTTWTTDALKNEHIGDYWRTTTIAIWNQWNSSTWTIISDPEAQAAADLAQNTADIKTTLWVSLSAAKAGASEDGDMFLEDSLLYRTTTSGSSITVANSIRMTAKYYPSVANDAARNALTGMILGDKVYQVDTLQWYKYTTLWETDGPSLKTVPVIYSPKYIGRSIAVHPVSKQEGDWWTVCATAGSAVAAGVYYYDTSVSSVPTVITTSSSSVLQGKFVAALEDIAWAEKHGYQTASAYGGFDVFFQALGAVRAYIDELFANTITARESITIATGGTILSQNYASGVSGFHMAGDTGDAEFNNVTMRGTMYASAGSFSGDIAIGTADTIFKADSNGIYLGDATFADAPFKVSQAGELTALNAVLSATLTAGGSIAGTNIKIENSELIIISGTSFTSPSVGDNKMVITLEGTYPWIKWHKCFSAGTWSVAYVSISTILDSDPALNSLFLGNGGSVSLNLHNGKAIISGSIDCYGYSSSSTLDDKTRTTVGNTDFTVKKPITVVLRATGTEFFATLSHLWNSQVTTIISSSSDNATSSGVMASIAPGRYRFSTTAGEGVNNPNAILSVVGVFGSSASADIWS